MPVRSASSKLSATPTAGASMTFGETWYCTPNFTPSRGSQKPSVIGMPTPALAPGLELDSTVRVLRSLPNAPMTNGCMADTAGAGGAGGGGGGGGAGAGAGVGAGAGGGG